MQPPARKAAAVMSRAAAKVNLTLHVLGRRADGLHRLESLVAFAGACDHLTLTPARDLSLTVAGQTGHLAGDGADNLVMKAANAFIRAFPGAPVGAFRLTKRLPVAAGLGGGSSDAAAALRLLADLNGLPADHPAIVAAARQVGADVPVCLMGRGRMMRDAGETLGPTLALPALFAVLVNPGVLLPTASVFGALGLAPGCSRAGAPHPDIAKPMESGGLIDFINGGRNDLEQAAIGLAPVIAEALDLVRAGRTCRLARMSGSGATVFGLYDDCRAAAEAGRAMRRARPDWWIKPTLLR
jgi:4-diphosphocytidyl-2-C-methyl-D-erythritol kinase